MAHWRFGGPGREEDPLAPARGILVGIVAGIVIWILVIAAILAFR